jgi:hypothetical protein
MAQSASTLLSDASRFTKERFQVDMLHLQMQGATKWSRSLQALLILQLVRLMDIKGEERK